MDMHHNSAREMSPGTCGVTSVPKALLRALTPASTAAIAVTGITTLSTKPPTAPVKMLWQHMLSSGDVCQELLVINAKGLAQGVSATIDQSRRAEHTEQSTSIQGEAAM